MPCHKHIIEVCLYKVLINESHTNIQEANHHIDRYTYNGKAAPHIVYTNSTWNALANIQGY